MFMQYIISFLKMQKNAVRGHGIRFSWLLRLFQIFLGTFKTAVIAFPSFSYLFLLV